ncbi:methyl-accepting chemotaxis protein [Clostridium pascui]|uniref:methyl-accepting chemotaxis protein n=1 Tax=Clostridium pascui TaxID=46609 RepID=UPI001FAFA6A0|nr:methyl-accepting chemotaxis protein [Clostridium pascui]MBM7871286.1 methyl-accepting chemotaxis protein [Clostridium pascui]
MILDDVGKSIKTITEGLLMLKGVEFTGIRAKLMTSFISICIIPLIFLGIMSYRQSKLILSNKLEVTSKQMLSQINNSLNNYFEGISVQLKMASNNLNFKTVDKDDKETIKDIKGYLDDIKGSSSDILNVFYGTESGKFLISPQAELSKDYNFKTKDWYNLALENKGTTIATKPYKDAVTGEFVVTVSRTVEDNGSSIGVVGIDISLKAITNIFSKSRVGETGYLCITDSDGIIISHPDQKLLGTDTVTKLSLWKDVAVNEKGFTEYIFEGKKKYASYDTSKITGWKLLATLNESELTSDINKIKNVTIIMILIVIVIATLISIFLSGGIAKNIAKLKEVFKKASEGNLTIKIDIKSKDELGQLGRDFNLMMASISKLLSDVKYSSLTVLESATSLASMSEETTASISEVSKAIEEISQGATNQSQTSQEGALNVGELAVELEGIEVVTQEMDSISNDAENLGSKGLVIVKTLSQKSDKTKESTVKISKVILDMSRSTEQISVISNTISEITEQTNLLSLNASIEAARAGEAGRGFAVVADEIRKLADESRNSTVEIKKIIETIQGKSQIAVNAIEETESIVKEQDDIVSETKQIFDEIIRAILILGNKVKDINKSIFSINSSKDIVVEKIESISSISEETASATEEVTASAEEINATMHEVTKYTEQLQNLAEKLQNGVNKFKIE